MPTGRLGRVIGTYEKLVTGLPYIRAHAITLTSSAEESRRFGWSTHYATGPPKNGRTDSEVYRPNRLAAIEPVLIAQSFKNALASVSLLAVPAEVLLQLLIDKTGNAIQFGPLGLGRPLKSGRDRKAYHLLHARTRYSKVKSSSSFFMPSPRARRSCADGHALSDGSSAITFGKMVPHTGWRLPQRHINEETPLRMCVHRRNTVPRIKSAGSVLLWWQSDCPQDWIR